MIRLCLLLFFLLLTRAEVMAQSVTWTSDRATPLSGTATGRDIWTTPQLTLKAGINNITITATDANGNSGASIIQITYVPTYPGPTLAGAWGFETGSGPTATDSSNNNNTGSLVNNPTWTGTSGGAYRNALSFNGSNQTVSVSGTNNNTLNFTQSFTLAAWVKPTAIHSDFRSVITKNPSVSDEPPPYQLYGSIAGYCGDGGFGAFMRVNGPGTSGTLYHVCDTTPLQQNVFTHIAVTYDNATGLLKLYRQGALVPTSGTSIGTASGSGYIEPTSGNLEIGSNQNSEFFEGVIDEVRVYNAALPLSGGANTVFGQACVASDQNAIATASIIGAANCPVVSLSPPTSFKLGSGTTVKLGAGQTHKFGVQP